MSHDCLWNLLRLNLGGLGGRPNVPPITEEQAETLDGLHSRAQEHALTLSMQRRDMQFINDLSIMYARIAYTDDALQRYVVLLHLLIWALRGSIQASSGQVTAT